MDIISGWETGFSEVNTWFSSLLSQQPFQQGVNVVYGAKADTSVLKVRAYLYTVVPTKCDSDIILCLQLLSKTLTCTLHLS